LVQGTELSEHVLRSVRNSPPAVTVAEEVAALLARGEGRCVAAD